jgi:glutamate racemase
VNSGSGPIGIFDSGIGGLTVTSSVHELLPREALLYYGDTLHMPYGEKSQKSIEQYSLCIAKYLLEQGAKALVIACNSASATASEAVRRLAGDSVPVIDVINPALGALAQMKQDIRVGVIGTKATIRSQVYPDRISNLLPLAQVQCLETPLLAPIVEEGLADGPISREVLRHYLGHPILQGIDCLILACTHYPLLQKEVEAHYQGRVDVLDSAGLTAQAVQEALKKIGSANPSEGHSSHRFLISEHTAAFAESAQRLFGGDIQLEEARLRV